MIPSVGCKGPRFSMALVFVSAHDKLRTPGEAYMRTSVNYSMPLNDICAETPVYPVSCHESHRTSLPPPTNQASENSGKTLRFLARATQDTKVPLHSSSSSTGKYQNRSIGLILPASLFAPFMERFEKIGKRHDTTVQGHSSSLKIFIVHGCERRCRRHPHFSFDVDTSSPPFLCWRPVSLTPCSVPPALLIFTRAESRRRLPGTTFSSFASTRRMTPYPSTPRTSTLPELSTFLDWFADIQHRS